MKLKWDISNMLEVGANEYISGDEILAAIVVPEGYSVWAIADIDDLETTIIIFGNGNTEEEARKNLQTKIDRFSELLK